MPTPVTLVSPWRRSSHSMVGDNNNCVELAATRHAVIVRDSKADGGGPVLEFSRSAWGDFVHRVRR